MCAIYVEHRKAKTVTIYDVSTDAWNGALRLRRDRAKFIDKLPFTTTGYAQFAASWKPHLRFSP